MNIAWCTPFTANSAIGRFSSLVVAALRDDLGLEVDIWYPPQAGGRHRPDPGRPLGAGVEPILRRYDSVVYHFGDHAPYHRRLVELSRSVPGLVVLHDLSLTHLMLAELLSRPPALMARELSRWLGQPTADQVGAEMVADPGNWPWSVENVTRFPLTELALGAALGVVTHSEFAASDVRERFAGDVWAIPLPALHFVDEDVDGADLSDLDERTVILQAGVLNPNKQIYKVLEAFELADISDRAQLVICGYADDNTLSSLRHEVSQRGLSNSVRVLGPVSDATLHGLRQRASIATVLRDPCIEAASAVLLDSMAYGLAVLTVNIGHYLEVPASTVARVNVPVDVAEIADVLRQWIGDPAAVDRTGSAARRHALEVHTPLRYAQAFAQVLTDVGGYGRRQTLAADLAATLTRVGFNGGDPITELVSESSAQLFGSSPRLADKLIYNR